VNLGNSDSKRGSSANLLKNTESLNSQIKNSLI